MADWQKPNQSFSLLGTGNGAVLGFAVDISSPWPWLDMVKSQEKICKMLEAGESGPTFARMVAAESWRVCVRDSDSCSVSACRKYG